MRLLWSIIEVISLYCSLILWNILIYVNFNNLNGMLNVMKFKLFINYCSLKQQYIYIYIYIERERERERERLFNAFWACIGQVFKPYGPHIIFTIHFGKTLEIFSWSCWANMVSSWRPIPISYIHSIFISLVKAYRLDLWIFFHSLMKFFIDWKKRNYLLQTLKQKFWWWWVERHMDVKFSLLWSRCF